MSEALLLGIDTSGSEGSLAVARVAANTEPVALAEIILAGRHYADELVSRLKDLLLASSIALADLDGIVVVDGPGSFTGLRAGIAAAKALAEAAAIPMIGISRLALVAGDPAEVHAAALDAGRAECYLRLPQGQESVELAESLAKKTTGMTIRICEPLLETRLSLAGSAVQIVPCPTAFAAICLALPRWLVRAFDDTATLDANYVRRPYAQPSVPA